MIANLTQDDLSEIIQDPGMLDRFWNAANVAGVDFAAYLRGVQLSFVF
jgi:hypothetical protein